MLIHNVDQNGQHYGFMRIRTTSLMLTKRVSVMGETHRSAVPFTSALQVLTQNADHFVRARRVQTPYVSRYGSPRSSIRTRSLPSRGTKTSSRAATGSKGPIWRDNLSPKRRRIRVAKLGTPPGLPSCAWPSATGVRAPRAAMPSAAWRTGRRSRGRLFRESSSSARTRRARSCVPPTPKCPIK